MYKLKPDELINRSKKKFNNKFNYNEFEYVNPDSIVEVICPIHGGFKISVYNHNQSKDGGCLKCQKDKHLLQYENNGLLFVNKAIIIHNNKYNYSNVKYTNNCTLVNIKCPIHGVFKMSPNCHLKGQGCKFCSRNTQGGYGGYCITNAERFKSTWSIIPAKLYVTKLYSDTECFIKIGITTHEKLSTRVKGIPYKKEYLKFIESDLYSLTKFEQSLLIEYKKYNYKPHLSFKGHSECFNLELWPIIKNTLLVDMLETNF